jgi:hypothetical protein
MWTWLAEGAHVYICGDAKRMAKDVERALVDIVAQFGARSTDEAKLGDRELGRRTKCTHRLQRVRHIVFQNLANERFRHKLVAGLQRQIGLAAQHEIEGPLIPDDSENIVFIAAATRTTKSQAAP